MSGFEWFLLIIVVVVVPLAIAVTVTLWSIDQTNKRKRSNRKDAQIGVKREAALTPEEVVARKSARAAKAAAAAAAAENAASINDQGVSADGSAPTPATSENTSTGKGSITTES